MGIPMQRVTNILLLAIIALASRSIDSDVVAAAPGPATGGGGEQTVAIIVNQSNPVENFSFDELRRIFMGERSHWPNGRRIALVMLDTSQPERKAVLRDIYEMSEKDFNQHFIQGVFSGAVLVSPKTLASSADVRKFVFNVPGAIGYVRASDVDPSVKVLHVDGRLPEDKDYRLRLSARSGMDKHP
jgi:ABC-type phosphate transport system substrate-binding protein